MKSLAFLATLFAASCVMAADAPKGELIGDPKIVAPLDVAATRAAGLKASDAAEKIGWRIGTQTYTLRDRGLLEALDTAYMLGLKYVECFPGHGINKKGDKVAFGPGMPEEAVEAVKKKLDQTGIKVLSMGVTGIPADEAGARKLFEFAKGFGMERIVSEAPKEQFPLIEKLAEEFDIDVALHNHPEPNTYGTPDRVLQAVGKFKRIGSCSDVGHWQRSAVEPIAALKKLKGRVFESHFKDLQEFGVTSAHDVPWGTGAGNAKGMLEECYRQTKAGNIGGTSKKMTFNIEYEIGTGTELVGNMAKSIEWFGQECEELGKK